MEIKENKDKVAIVVVGYNRKEGLERLLKSVSNATYNVEDVPLIISIDCSHNEEVYNFVKNYEWVHGPLYINIQEERLGLKNHIFKCGDYTKYFKGIIILEDDIFVSPDFYNYTLSAFEKYEEESKVAGISLYNVERNGFIGLPFKPLNNGYDVYAWQAVSSWGEAWTDKMWSNFKKWLSSWNEDFDEIPMPSVIKTWGKAWSKYYYAYIISNDLYIIYPYCSLTTNFNDVGGENGGGGSLVQVSLQEGHRDYDMPEFSSLVKYDVFQQNVALYDILNIKEEDLCLDLYGMTFSDLTTKKPYLLTIKKYDYPVIKTYSLAMRPIELNIKYAIKGTGIYLYDTTSVIKGKGNYTNKCLSYFLQGFSVNLLLRYMFNFYWTVFKRKMHL